MLPLRLRDATRPWHVRAERSGVMGLLLRRRLSRGGYRSLLLSLLALYDALEPALEREAAHLRALGPLPPALGRAGALRADLKAFGPAGTDAVADALAIDYAARLDGLRGERAHRLLAHVYVRYLGDLHGGQILGALVREHYRLPGADGTRFYDFGDEAAVQQLRADLRGLLAAVRLSAGQADEVVDEAVWAFAAHVALFEQLARQEPASAQEGADLLVQGGGASG